MEEFSYQAKDLWPVEAGVGEIIYPPGGSFGPRRQTNVQMVILHSGEMTVWVDAQKKFSPASTVCLLLPGHQERFIFAPDRETHHSWLHAYLPGLPLLLAQRLAQLPWSIPLSPFMTDLISQALHVNASFNPTSPALLGAMAAQMLWLYIGEAELQSENVSSPLPHPVVAGAVQYIQAHLEEDLSLGQIAATVGVSPVHLIRLFQKYFGTTVMAFVWQQRVKLGINLLKNTGLTVTAVAQKSGFQNSFHFSKRVRQATGSSPLELRNHFWHERIV